MLFCGNTIQSHVCWSTGQHPSRARHQTRAPSERAHSAPRFHWDQCILAPQMSYCSDYFALAPTKKEPEGYEKGRNSILLFRVPRLRNLIEEPKHPPNKEDSTPFAFLTGQTWLLSHCSQSPSQQPAALPGSSLGNQTGAKGHPRSSACVRLAPEG